MKPSRSGRTSTPRLALETNPFRMATKRKFSCGGPTSLRRHDRTTDPRPSLVAPRTALPVSPDPSPEQIVISAAHVDVPGMPPGQAPVSAIATTSDAATYGLHGRAATPASA